MNPNTAPNKHHDAKPRIQPDPAYDFTELQKVMDSWTRGDE